MKEGKTLKDTRMSSEEKMPPKTANKITRERRERGQQERRDKEAVRIVN